MHFLAGRESDKDKNRMISYDEFLRAVRGPLNMARKKIVAQAFKKLDKDGNQKKYPDSPNKSFTMRGPRYITGPC